MEVENVKQNILKRDQIFAEHKMNDMWKAEKVHEKMNIEQKDHEVNMQKNIHIKVIKREQKSIRRLAKLEMNLIGKLQHTIDLEKLENMKLDNMKQEQQEFLETFNLS